MKLFKYQEEIYDKVKDKQSIGLFMEAGTGKTILSQYMWTHNPTSKLLIICLASKVDEWEQDNNNYFNENNKVFDICTLNKGYKENKKMLQEDFDIFIISFQSLLLLGKEMLETINKDWTIIIDESQFIKNYKSKTSKLCHKLSTKTEYKMILTGTPQNKGYIDYFSQLKFLGVFTTVKQFQDRFCIMELVRYGGNVCFLDIVNYKNTDILDNIISDNAIFFKRTREIDEIPDQKYINFERNKYYPKFLRDKVYEDIACTNMGVLRLRSRQLCGGSINQYRFETGKTNWIEEFIENTFTKIVIFYNFNEECEILKEIIKKLKRPLSIYNGTIKDITNFEKYDNSILLVNYKSGGTGINWLKIAYIAVFWSPPESYLEFEQARKRIDRIGQDNKPMFYCLRTLKTVEQAIYESIEMKEDFDNQKFIKYLESEK